MLHNFTPMAELMKDNPPAPQDMPMLLKLEKLGMQPIKSFDAKANLAIAKALDQGRSIGLQRILAYTKTGGALVNGWIVNPGNYSFGNDYLARAFLCAYGIPANRPADATYPYAEIDKDNRPLDGVSKYVIRFCEPG